MGAVFGGSVEIAVQIVGGNRNSRKRLWREIPSERLLHVGDAEHARTRAGHCEAYARIHFGDENAHDRVMRGRVAKLGIASAPWNRKPGFRDDFAVFQCSLKQTKKIVIG